MIIGNSGTMEAALMGIKDAFDGGRLAIFAGPVPSSPDAELDMINDHTALAVITVDDDGVTGLTFANPSGNVLVKEPSEDWIGTISFSGAEDGETTLTPTFFRFYSDGDDPTSEGTGAPRVQGTVGGPSSGADMLRTTEDMTANGTNVIGVSVFNLTQNAFA